MFLLFRSTEATSPTQTADEEQKSEYELGSHNRGEQGKPEDENEYENDSFVNEDEERDKNQGNGYHENEYENDSFIIEDNGATNDGDLTSSSASPLSEAGYQSQDEVSNENSL